jgi:tetratricopeptide (TPR) repeat protein
LSSHRMVRLLVRDPARLREAIAVTERALADAQHALDPVHVDRYAVALGDLAYRAGDGARAVAAYRIALDQRARVGSVEDLRKIEVAIAIAAYRSGDTATARTFLGRALASAPATASGRAELAALGGGIAAREGRTVDAETAINEAIDGAIESGDAATFVRVAIAAADACVTLIAR